MEVKPGYKQTEVGVVPDDWGVESLDRIADPKRSICYGIVQVGQFSNDGIAVLAIRNLNGDYVTDVHRCSYETEKAYARSRVRPGDVLVSVKGTIGRIGLVPSHFSGNISRDLARIALTDSDIPAFWHQLLQSEMAQRRLQAMAVGTTRMELSIGPLKQVEMPRPSKEEQRAIATALSDVDALLAALDRLITKKSDLKRATMQQLLTGQTRLPGFSSARDVKGAARIAKPGYKRTEVGVIPEGWETAKLGEKTEKIGSGITPTGGERVYKPHGRPFIRSQNVGWGTLLLDDVAFIDDATHSTFPDTEIRLGDVFLNITGASIGRSAIADSRIQGGNVNQHVCIIRAQQTKLYPRFLNYCLLSAAGQRQIDSFQAGGNRQGLNFAQVRSIEIPVPPVPEQCAIADALEDMDAELTTLDKRLAKTLDLKKGMMQELLTGKTRLVSEKASHA